MHRSVCCYVGELAGFTWYFHDSIERVVHLFSDGTERVVYKTKYYDLLPAKRMKSLIKTHTRYGGAVHVGGAYISSDDVVRRYDPFPFIDIRTPKEVQGYLNQLTKLAAERKARIELNDARESLDTAE